MLIQNKALQLQKSAVPLFSTDTVCPQLQFTISDHSSFMGRVLQNKQPPPNLSNLNTVTPDRYHTLSATINRIQSLRNSKSKIYFPLKHLFLFPLIFHHKISRKCKYPILTTPRNFPFSISSKIKPSTVSRLSTLVCTCFKVVKYHLSMWALKGVVLHTIDELNSLLGESPWKYIDVHFSKGSKFLELLYKSPETHIERLDWNSLKS